MMNKLWLQLRTAGHVQGEPPATDLSAAGPWYIGLMQGFAGWFAALFMLGFVASMFGWLFRFDNELALLAVGGACCAAAYLLFRTHMGSIFFGQLGMAVSLAGQMMVAWGLLDWFSLEGASGFFLLAAFQAVLTFVMPNYLHRVMTCWFALIALFMALNMLGIFGLGAAVCAVLFVLVWINDSHWGRFIAVWEPIGFGLALALVQFNGYLIFGDPVFMFMGQEVSAFWLQWSLWINSAMLVVAAALLFQLIQKRYQLSVQTRAGQLLIAGMALLVLSGFIAQGTSAALLILLVGFLQQRRALMGLGALALLGFFSWYYYSLHATLLVKSLILIGSGAVLLLARLAVGYLLSRPFKPVVLGIFALPALTRGKRIALTALLAIVVLVNFTVWQREALLSSGQSVLLPLAPVDPRSLMQGDYMRLRFALERDVEKALPEGQTEGVAVVALDANQVGQFVRLDDGTVLAEGQARLQFRIRHGDIQFATNAFFFQEGEAETFEQARFGEFRVDDAGALLLNTLRDEHYQVLGYNRP